MLRHAFIGKVSPPKRRPDILPRPRLTHFLLEHVDKRLMLICAGAGYGKTTLLTEFAGEVGLPVCWYTLDESDSDPRVFFEYVILSLRQRFPGFGRRTESLLNSTEDVGREIRSLVASLTGEIQSDIDDYFIFVLDDVHWLDQSEILCSALDLMLAHLPDNCHMVLASRTLPRLSYARLAAQRQAVGLGKSDLRFGPEELGRLARETYHLTMPTRQLEELIESSEGWITAIILRAQALWMGEGAGTVGPKGAGSPLFDYLAAEVYQQQPEDVRRFLLCSSILDRLSPERCQRLFGADCASDILRHLVDANLFLAELDGPGEWYRYHNLFQNFLQIRLKSEDPALYRDLRRRAAEMDEAEGDWDAAIGHYAAIPDLNGAAGLMERVAREMVNAGRWRTLDRWLDSLPREFVDARPALSVYRGHTYLWAGKLDQALTHLNRTIDQCRARNDDCAAAEALNVKGMALRLKGRLAPAMKATGQALALQSDEGSPVAAVTHRERGICLASLGKPSQAAAELLKAMEICQALGDQAGEATTCQSLGLVAVRTGDLSRGMAHYQRASRLWEAVGNRAYMAGVLNCIASVHQEVGEYRKALEIAEEGLSLAREAGYLRSEAFALATQGDARRDSGDLTSALESYDASLGIAQRIEDAQLTNYLLDAMANTHRLLGEYATAERLHRQAVDQAEENESPGEVASYSISGALLAEELGDLPRAEKLLRLAIDRLPAFEAVRDLARSHFHLARVLFAGNRPDEAKSELECSLDLCQKLGHDQFMVAEGQRAGALLSWAMGRGMGGRRLELVAERLRLAPARQAAPVKMPRLRIESSGPRLVQVHALGESRVVVDGRTVTSSEWAVEKTKELFFFLVSQPNSVRKEQVIDALWPDLDIGRCSSQFHSTMYRLRRALSNPCVTFHDGRYQLLAGQQCWFDVEEYDRLLAEADSLRLEAAERVELYEKALSLYRGPFLEEFYADWVRPRREELRQRHLQATARLARLRADQGDLPRSVELLSALVALDPYQEEAQCELIRCMARIGDRATALRKYRDYVQLLHDELEASPGPRLSALAKCIARGDAIPPQ